MIIAAHSVRFESDIAGMMKAHRNRVIQLSVTMRVEDLIKPSAEGTGRFNGRK